MGGVDERAMDVVGAAVDGDGEGVGCLTAHAGGRVGHFEGVRPPAEPGALRLCGGLLGRPEPGEPQGLGLPGPGDEPVEEAEFAGAEGDAVGLGGAVRDLFDVDTDAVRVRAGARGAYESDGQITPVGEGQVERRERTAVHPHGTGSPRLLVHDLDLGREHRALAALPQPPPYRVLGGDPAEQPLPTAARRSRLVRLALGPAELHAHQQVAGGQVRPHVPQQAPAAGPGLGEGEVFRVAAGPACVEPGEPAVAPARELRPHRPVGQREPDVGEEGVLGERGDDGVAVDGGAGGRVRPEEAGRRQGDGEDHGPGGVGRHQPVAEELAHVVEERARRGWCGDRAPDVAGADPRSAVTPWKAGPWNIHRSSYSWAAAMPGGRSSAASSGGAGGGAG